MLTAIIIIFTEMDNLVKYKMQKDSLVHDILHY